MEKICYININTLNKKNIHSYLVLSIQTLPKDRIVIRIVTALLVIVLLINN